MRHLPVSEVASLLLVLLLAVLPAAPAKADEVGDSFQGPKINTRTA